MYENLTNESWEHNKQKSHIQNYRIALLSFILYFVLTFGLANLISHFELATEDNQLLLNVVLNSLVIIPIILLNYNLLKEQWIRFVKKFRLSMLESFKGWGFLVLFNALAAMLVMLLGGSGTSANQTLLQTLLPQNQFLFFIMVVIEAPLLEELVFRLSLRGIIRNKYLFILSSGLVFGLLHVVQAGDYLFSIPYISMGIVLGYFYTRSNNIFVTISIHTFQNLFSFIMMASLF